MYLKTHSLGLGLNLLQEVLKYMKVFILESFMGVQLFDISRNNAQGCPLPVALLASESLAARLHG
jgi:hypothetical protein